MEALHMKRIQQGCQLVHPRVERPQLRVTVEIALATAQLVIADNLPVGHLSQWIQHFKVIVGRARSAMQQYQRRVVARLSYNTVECSVAP